MNEKAKQPSEQMFKDADSVAAWMDYKQTIIEGISYPHVRAKMDKQRLELYPPQSCATCGFCLGPVENGLRVYNVAFCVSVEVLDKLPERKKHLGGLVRYLQGVPSNEGLGCVGWRRKQASCQDPKKGGEEPG